MIGATGPLAYNYGATELVEAGYACKPKIVMVMSERASAPEMPYDIGVRESDEGHMVTYRRYPDYVTAYQNGVMESEEHNRTVLRAAEWMVDHGRGTLILCRRKPHFRKLQEMLEAAGIQHVAIWGGHNIADRNRAKKLFASKRVKVLLASTILDEGEDVPGADAIILAEGIKSQINAVQRIGRGMMLDRNGPSDFYVVDIVPTCHPTLIAHGLARCKAYEAEGHEVRVVTEWLDDDAPGFNYDTLLPFKDWTDAVAA